jgi:hypothetical protein
MSSKPEFFFSPLSFGNKEAYLLNGTRFNIISFAYQPNAGFENSDVWYVRVVVISGGNDGVQEILTFAPNPRRDKQFGEAQNFIELHGPIWNKHLIRPHLAYFIEDEPLATAA